MGSIPIRPTMKTLLEELRLIWKGLGYVDGFGYHPGVTVSVVMLLFGIWGSIEAGNLKPLLLFNFPYLFPLFFSARERAKQSELKAELKAKQSELNKRKEFETNLESLLEKAGYDENSVHLHSESNSK